VQGCVAFAALDRSTVNTSQAEADLGQKLASPFLDLMPISGVAISVLDREKKASVIHATDDTAARLEEIHFTLGEGPLFDCFTSARPVLVPSVRTDRRWPVFTSHADGLTVGSLFLFPLTLGAACVGTVLCYRDVAGELDSASIETGSSLARAVSGPALRRAIQLAGHENPDEESTPIEMRREVHQATGMMLIQLDIDATDALARMRAYAFSHGISLREVARNVVTRRLDFSSSRD
jgi:ANTAR domain